MALEVIYDKKCSCIKVKVDGELTIEVLKNIAREVNELSQKYNCSKILNNLLNATANVSALDIYQMPKIAKECGVNNWFKRALIVGDRKEEFEFLETVFLNQGHIVQLFENEEQGYAWLMRE